jgi:hypothetical protein
MRSGDLVVQSISALGFRLALRVLSGLSISAGFKRTSAGRQVPGIAHAGLEFDDSIEIVPPRSTSSAETAQVVTFNLLTLIY